MRLGEMDDIKQRVDKLECKVEPLSSLPEKFDMFIEAQRETNQCIKELSKSMREDYVSKEVSEVQHKTVDDRLDKLEKFPIWVYVSAIGTMGVIIMKLWELK